MFRAQGYIVLFFHLPLPEAWILSSFQAPIFPFQNANFSLHCVQEERQQRESRFATLEKHFSGKGLRKEFSVRNYLEESVTVFNLNLKPKRELNLKLNGTNFELIFRHIYTTVGMFAIRFDLTQIKHWICSFFLQ